MVVDLTEQRRWRAYAELLAPRLFGFGAHFSLRDAGLISSRIREGFGGWRLESLPTALRVVTTDAATGECIVLSRGSLADALCAMLAHSASASEPRERTTHSPVAASVVTTRNGVGSDSSCQPPNPSRIRAEISPASRSEKCAPKPNKSRRQQLRVGAPAALLGELRRPQGQRFRRGSCPSRLQRHTVRRSCSRR